MPDYPLRPRPRLARWLFDRALEYPDVGGKDGPLGCSVMTISLICRPFDDPKRRVPNKGLMERIIRLTGGECTPDSFFAPSLAEIEASPEGIAAE